MRNNLLIYNIRTIRDLLLDEDHNYKELRFVDKVTLIKHNIETAIKLIKDPECSCTIFLNGLNELIDEFRDNFARNIYYDNGSAEMLYKRIRAFVSDYEGITFVNGAL